MFRSAKPWLTASIAILLTLSKTTCFVSQCQKASAEEIGFVEDFALASNRDAELAKLIPGTEDFYLYSCLHNQTTGKLAVSQSILDAWISKFGLTENARRMQMRQMLLNYNPTSPEATLNYLKQNLGLNIYHDRPNPNEAAQLATKLDPALIDWAARFQEAVTTNNRLEQIEDIVLGEALQKIQFQPDFRSWISRLNRPDLPDTVDTIAKELKLPDTRGFGWAPVHQLLSRDQLDQLLKLLPKLIESDSFVQARLRRIRPIEDISLADKKSQRAHLEELQAFVAKLPDSQASLKAHVLFQRLLFDASEGTYDRQRFLEYLRLPRQSSTINREFLQLAQNRVIATLTTDYSAITTLAPINDDSQLIQEYLEHFFQSDANADIFAPFIDRDCLKLIFASTKLLYGLGDSKTFYAQLSPAEQKEIRDRVEMRFARTNPKYWSPQDTVKLSVSIKNVPRVTMKIYQIQTRNLLTAQQKQISTDVDLDGLVANSQRVLEFAQPSDRRHSETIALPEMEGRGVWVVDLFGGGQRSRVLIQKGQLRSLHTICDAGHLFRVIDEQGSLIPNAKLIVGEREFASTAKDGAIVVPFAEQSQSRSILLVEGDFASLETFTHLKEEYTLQGGFLVDPQSLLAGSKAALVLRSQLLLQGTPVPIASLEKPQVTLRATDQDGIETTQTFSDLQLSDTLESVIHFFVPQRLRTLTFTFTGRVRNLSLGTFQDLSSSYTTTVNTRASTAQIADFYLTQVASGFALEALGRNGEKLSQLPVSIELKLRGLRNRVSTRLATDANGRIEFGELPRIESIQVTAKGIATRDFVLDAPFLNWPSTMHGIVGKSLQVAWPETGEALKNYPQRLSLTETRDGTIASIRNDSLTVQNGVIKIEKLPAGLYQLTDHLIGQSIRIRIVESRHGGAAQEKLLSDLVVGASTALEKDHYVPVHVSKASIVNDNLTIQIQNADAATRVHIVAMPFDQSPSLVSSLTSVPIAPNSSKLNPTPSFYIDSMKLDEEYQYVLARQLAKKYPGNMLPQPSVLQNPWELSVTNNESQLAAAGDAIAAIMAPAPSVQVLQKSMENYLSGLNNSGEAIYEFLSRGTLLVANLRPDEKGLIEIDSELVADQPNVFILAIHPSGTTYRRVAMPSVKPRTTNDQTLKNAYAEAIHLAERQVVRILRTGDPSVDLGEATSSRVKLFTNWADAYGLMSTLLKGDAELEKFRPLTNWSKLNEMEKHVQYGLLASHEMHLFLSVHDADYFNRFVKPTLTVKYAKQLVDDVLLNRDLLPYTTPSRLALLNAAERALLGRNLVSQFGSNQRWLSDSLRVTDEQQDPRSRYARFETALLGGLLGDHDRGSVGWGIQNGESFGFALPAAPSSGAEAASTLDIDSNSLRDPAISNRSLSMDRLGRSSNLKLRDRKDAERSKKQDKANYPEKSSSLSDGNITQLFSRRELAEAESIPFYQSLEKTRKWAECQFFRIALENQRGSLIIPNAYWIDYLKHSKDGTPFLSTNLTDAAYSTTDALMALAVLQLPLDGKSCELSVEDGRILVKQPTEALAYIQKIEPIEPAKDSVPLLIGQDLYLVQPSDSGLPRPIVSKSLLVNVAYRASVVVTNPTATLQRVQVLTQVPQGAIALSNGKPVRSTPIDIAPYSSQQIAYEFYFPQPGAFQHYGAQVSNTEGFLAASVSKSWNVLAVPDEIDQTTWSYVAAWGTEEQVMEFLEIANLKQIDLSAIAWRMKSKSFFEATLTKLDSLGCFDTTLWSYSVVHNDRPRLRELIESMPQVFQIVGPFLDSPLFVSQPIESLQFEHYDFRPLVVARMHQLGSKRVILNDELASHYDSFMNLLAYQKSISADQSLGLVYYLLLQNRIEEAIVRFDTITREQTSLGIQYDYFAAYLNFYRGDFDSALMMANKYIDHPQLKWRDWFTQVRDQIQERNAIQIGERSETVSNEDWKKESQQRLLSGQRNNEQLQAAAKLPSLEILEEAGQYKLQHRNVNEVDVHYYLMDIELLFTRKPFVQNNDSRLNVIAPNRSEKLKLGSGDEVFALAIPDDLKNRNLVIEVVGGGLVRSTVVYNNALVVTLSTTMGQLQVTSQKDRQPLESTYVKVYAKHHDGSIRFYKDGYTDLRGKFDYASVSTIDADTAEKFSILVLHPEKGAAICEAQVPVPAP
ncbi:MAG: hypothetical protein NTW52_13400 [Planctomycetota bacterium]|nr:hypothetical protein [Planctomycetota bacterium]